MLQCSSGGQLSGIEFPAAPVKRYHWTEIPESQTADSVEDMCLSALLSSVYDVHAAGSACKTN